MRFLHVASWTTLGIGYFSIVSSLSTGAPSLKTVEEVAGPTKWPVVGTLPDFLSRGGADGMLDVHMSMYQEYGDVYKMSIFGDDEAVFCDPREYEKVFRSEGKYPYGSAQEGKVFLEYYENSGNEVAARAMKDGEEWRTWRQQLNPDVFALSAAKSYLPHIGTAARDASSVADRYSDEFDEFISRLAFDMFSGIMFGNNPQTADKANAEKLDLEFVTDTQEAFSLAGTIMVNPQEKIFKSIKYETFTKKMDNAFNFAKQRTLEFAKFSKDMQLSSEVSSIGVDGASESTDCPMTDQKGVRARSRRVFQNIKSSFNNILGRRKDDTTFATSVLVNGSSPAIVPPSCVARLLERGEMPLDYLSETVGSMLLAGVDTTAYVLGWLLLNIARSPSAQETLAVELKNVLDGSDITEATIDDLPYLRACIRESHRLTPPGPLTGVRRLPRDITMNGVTFPSGMRLSLNSLAYQMDPQYVDSPQEYQPERWLKDAVQKREGTAAEVIDHRLLAAPFGSGARMCVGARLADVEIMAATARLVQDWEITLDPPDQEWGLKQGLFIKADPFPNFKLVPRRT